jgi:hypothetical protein
VERRSPASGKDAGSLSLVLKWAVAWIAAIIVAYAIYVVTVINWPNPLKRPADELQREYALLFPIGMPRVEAEARLAERNLAWRQGSRPQPVVAANLGSYATANMLFVIPLHAVAVLQLSFDGAERIASVKVWKYVDGP